jgi:flagellar biosynthesis protein FliP
MGTAPHPYWLVFASLSLALVPILVGLCTSFVKVQVVLSFFRSGLGAQQVPSGLVILGLSLAMTGVIMAPTIERFHEQVTSFPWKNVQNNPINLTKEEIANLTDPWYQFLLRHSGEREIEAFAARLKPIQNIEEDTNQESQEPVVNEEAKVIPWHVLLPAFLVSELKEAFIIGFIVLIPFLVIDLIVANILAGVGMFMVSPVMISLPLKVALFTFADGWLLLAGGLTASYAY